MPKHELPPPSVLTGDMRGDLQNIHEWATALVRELSFMFGSLENEFEPNKENERRVIISGDYPNEEESDV